MVALSKLTEVTDIKKVWAHEANDFTPWLADPENIGLLSEAIGIDIEVEETESYVGGFRVDILAKEENSDRKIIIENQLEETDHDHLGKLITYASGKNAEIIIWVVKRAREEHKSAIEWLNNHTDNKVAFFLCEIKLYKIDDSNIAVKFEVVEEPNNWVKEQKSTLNPTLQFRYEYWNAFCRYAENDKKFTAAFKKFKPDYNHWLNLYIQTSRCHIALLNIQKDNEIGVEIYMTNDKDFYKILFEHKQEIEAQVGCELNWQELPEKKASRIILKRKADAHDEEDWNEQFEWLVQNALKMKRAAKKYLK